MAVTLVGISGAFFRTVCSWPATDTCSSRFSSSVDSWAEMLVMSRGELLATSLGTAPGRPPDAGLVLRRLAVGVGFERRGLLVNNHFPRLTRQFGIDLHVDSDHDTRIDRQAFLDLLFPVGLVVPFRFEHIPFEDRWARAWRDHRQK